MNKLGRKYFELRLAQDYYGLIEKKYLEEIESIISKRKLGHVGDI